MIELKLRSYFETQMSGSLPLPSFSFSSSSSSAPSMFSELARYHIDAALEKKGLSEEKKISLQKLSHIVERHPLMTNDECVTISNQIKQVCGEKKPSKRPRGLKAPKTAAAFLPPELFADPMKKAGTTKKRKKSKNNGKSSKRNSV